MIHPPKVGPMTGATTTPTPYTAIAVPCWRGGKLSSKIDWARGCMPPPPTPCRMRATISIGMLTAMPHSSDAPANTRMEIINRRLRPIRRVIHPAAGSMMALETR